MAVIMTRTINLNISIKLSNGLKLDSKASPQFFSFVLKLLRLSLAKYSTLDISCRKF